MNEVIRNVGGGVRGARRIRCWSSREVKTAGVLVVTSDRGLAGAYNTNVIRMAELRLIELEQGRGPTSGCTWSARRRSPTSATAATRSSGPSSASPTPPGTATPGPSPTC